MGALTRQYNWSNTSLGTPDQWPQSLCVTLSIVLNARFPMFLWWGPELIQFYNDAYRPSLGNTGKHPTALGQKGEECWPEVWPTVYPLIKQVMDGGPATWSEDQLIPIYRNGQLDDVYWTFSHSPVKDESGRVAGVLVTCFETTQKVQSFNRLRASEQRFQQLVAKASVGIVVVSGQDLRIEIVNESYAQLINRRLDDLQGKCLFDVLSEAKADLYPLIEQVRLTGNPLYLYDHPYAVLVEGNKKEGYFNLVAQPYNELDGTTTGVILLCQDVTGQVVSRQALEASEAKFRTLIEQAPVATCLFVGSEMRIDLANEAMITFFGQGPSIVGKPIREVLIRSVDGPAIQLLDNVFTTGKPFDAKGAPADLVINGVPGTYYFDISLKPLVNAAGNVYAILEMAVEVTQEVLAQQQRKESEAYLRQLTDAVPAIIWETQPDGYCTYLNGQWYEVTGQTTTEAQGFGWLDATHPDDKAETGRLFIEANQHHTAFRALYRLRQHDGQYRWSVDLGRPRFAADGTYVGMIGTVVDVHDQAIARQELAESEARLRKLSTELDLQVQQRTQQLQASIQDLQRSNENLGQFAYVASHDLQEPLRKIQQFGDLLKDQYAETLGEGLDHLNRMQSSAYRMSVLIRDLLTYSRISTRQEATRAIALSEAVQWALTDLELRITETGALIEVAPLPMVLGDASQLGQLFLNLLSNALKFRRPDTTPHIQIRVNTVPATDLPLLVRPTRTATAYHRIDVIDNGIGFEEKYIDRIFQVFQRLQGKGQYEGTGIGLAICEKVAANHGGAITATSQPGNGATFSVYLPV
ncbi:PAS domain S-box-containing protein [Spirosoma fluviale]|uniref:histidine kinase n=2 Tax=Spirosoma fluviale TaxID=1597977 RepID=A0A286GAJ0_9BACT|nr:PAS domain S-box-containing protein [Spirosoma fluviale]